MPNIPPGALIPVLRQLVRRLKPGVYTFTGPAAPLSIGLAVTGMMPANFDPRFTAKPVDGRSDARAVIDWAGIETRTQEERDLVAHLRSRDMTVAEIQNALDDLRDRRGREAEVGTMVSSMQRAGHPPAEIEAARETLREIHKRETTDAKDRNDGLPPQLRTSSSKARDAVIESDEKLREALAAAKVLTIHFAAHHLIPMEAVHRFQKLFEAAARAGWRPDEAENLVALPRNDDAKKIMDEALGERRGVHNSGHRKWNDNARERLEKLDQQFRAGQFSDAEVRRQLEHLQNSLRKAVPKTRVTMHDRHEGVV